MWVRRQKEQGEHPGKAFIMVSTGTGEEELASLGLAGLKNFNGPCTLGGGLLLSSPWL